MSRLSITPAPSNRSSKFKGKQRERTPHGDGDQDNFLDSHAYDDYGYHRSVSTKFSTCTLSEDKKTQLLITLSSLESRLEFVCNKANSCSANCVKCKRQTQETIEIMADSGTSDCFTHTKSDLSEFEQINDKRLVVKTASAKNSLKIKGRGALVIMHKVTHKGKSHTVQS